MATQFQNVLYQDNNTILGQTSSTNYTVIRGTLIYVGADHDGNADRVRPALDITAAAVEGLALESTADIALRNDNVCAYATFPMVIVTDNVDGTNPPENVLDNRVYALDAGTWSDADGDSGSHSYGYCTNVYSDNEYGPDTHYRLVLNGPDY